MTLAASALACPTLGGDPAHDAQLISYQPGEITPCSAPGITDAEVDNGLSHRRQAHVVASGRQLPVGGTKNGK